ncbi:MAG: protein kinase [Planctomycetes bacterium]|nr:protein kinase [Planctomycetota bacterium]
MNPVPPPLVNEDDVFEHAAAEFTARLRAGEHPSVEEYIARYAEVADLLRELLPTIEAVERSKASTVNSGAGAMLPQKMPERLGDFTIVRVLGHGGMGVVYEAVQESLSRHVALKILPAQALTDEKRVKRFDQEARLAARLYHPNIVPVFGVGHASGFHYYVMQLIDGHGVDRVITESPGQRLPTRQAAEIARDAARALHYAHVQGTLHRDVKPSNLLIDRKGSVWLADFGLAQALENNASVSTHVAGTLRYLPPERFQGVSDARGDVYGLGLTLYEMICGRPPFNADTAVALMKQITEGPAPAPRSVNPLLPRDLEVIVQKATARDPRHRYPTASAMAEDLTRYLEGMPIRARRISAFERGWRWCGRNKLLATASAMAMVSVATLLLVASISYYSTARLNSQLTSSLERERQSRALAEKSSSTALEALDKVFQQLAPAGAISAASSNDQDGNKSGDLAAAAGQVSPQVAAALEGLLPYYNRLAEQRGNDPQVLRQAALAKYRVGLIQARLGRLDEARLTWPQAASMLSELKQQTPEPAQSSDLAVALASLECDRGDWERMLDRFDDAQAAYQRALKAFDGLTVDKLPFEARRELARVYLALGSHERGMPAPTDGPGSEGQRRDGPPHERGPGRPPHEGPPGFRGPPGPGGPPDRNGPPRGEHRGPPPGAPGHDGRRPPAPPPSGGPEEREHIAHLDQAMALLKQLQDERPKDAQTLLYLARCYREYPPAAGETRMQAKNLATAERLLRELVAEHPETPDFAFELSETIVDFQAGSLQPAELPPALVRLHDASAISEKLIAVYPDTTLYAASRVHILHRLMTVAMRLGQRDEAERAGYEAVELQSGLVKKFPTVTAYGLWLVRIQGEQVGILAEAGKIDEAKRVLEEANQALKPYLGSGNSSSTVIELRDMLDHRRRRLDRPPPPR